MLGFSVAPGDIFSSITKMQMMNQEELKGKIQSWWNHYPFTYFVKEEIGSWAFFRNVDRKVFKWCPWAHDGYPLFGKFVPYKELAGKNVLDIGCGTGWSTEQFARMGARVSAIDLTEKAVELTKKRFALYNLEADIRVGDAEQMPYPDGAFDYVFVWGVLMHTPDTEKAIREIYRVLKPGGRAAAMMYNRNSLHFRWFLCFGKGILRGKLLKYSVQELANRYTDGAEIGGNMLTKFYTPSALKRLWSVFSKVRIHTYDNPAVLDVFPHRFLPLGRLLPKALKQRIANRFGLSSWIEAQK